MMYPFSSSDLTCSVAVLRNYMENAPSKVSGHRQQLLYCGGPAERIFTVRKFSYSTYLNIWYNIRYQDPLSGAAQTNRNSSLNTRGVCSVSFVVQDWYLRIGTCVCSAFQVPWADLRYLFGEIMYGGHIVNDFDRWGGEGAGSREAATISRQTYIVKEGAGRMRVSKPSLATFGSCRLDETPLSV